jgi:hypothetical protein
VIVSNIACNSAGNLPNFQRVVVLGRAAAGPLQRFRFRFALYPRASRTARGDRRLACENFVRAPLNLQSSSASKTTAVKDLRCISSSSRSIFRPASRAVFVLRPCRSTFF